jgi:hypothetical protein
MVAPVAAESSSFMTGWSFPTRLNQLGRDKKTRRKRLVSPTFSDTDGIAELSTLEAHCKVELRAMLRRERRRRWGLEEKLRMVAETQEAGACVRERVTTITVLPARSARLARA